MRRYLRLQAVSMLAVLPLAADIRITCLANEGVMIEGDGQKVLIDTLLRDGHHEYAQHPPAVQDAIETGKPPFDGIRIALATHYHLDHWDAGAIARFLRSNPEAVFGSTPQATGMLPAALQRRVHALPIGQPKAAILTSGRVNVDSIPLTHGRRQNLGYRITIGDRVLIHVGDADISSENLAALAATGKADVLMAPFWWFSIPRALRF